MATPRGRTEPACLTVNLDPPTRASLVEIAKREDVSVLWVIRRAIKARLARDRVTSVRPALSLVENGEDGLGPGREGCR